MIASDAKCRGMMTSLERVMRSTTSGMTSLERVPKQQPNLHSHQLQQPNLHSHRLLPACCSYPWTSWQQPIVSSVIMIVPRSAAGSGCKSRHCLQSHLTVAHTHTSSNPPRTQTYDSKIRAALFVAVVVVAVVVSSSIFRGLFPIHKGSIHPRM